MPQHLFAYSIQFLRIVSNSPISGTSLCTLLAFIFIAGITSPESHAAVRHASSKVSITLSPSELLRARERYQEALKELETGNTKRYKKLKRKLRHYPLYPYLLYSEYKSDIKSVPYQQISNFLTEYKNIPVAYRLRRHWLRHLAKTRQWQAYRDNFSTTSSSQLNCLHHWSQHQTNQISQAFAGAKKLWIVGNSQDEACDPLFKAWIQSTHFKADYAWERLSLAIKKGKPRLAKYIKRYLEPADKKLADQWLNVRRTPTTLTQINDFLPANIKQQEIILYGIQRLLHRNSRQALQLLSTYEAYIDFDKAELAALHYTIAGYMGSRQLDDASYWLGLTHDEQNSEFIERKIRYALRAQNWHTIYHYLNLLPAQLKEKNRWQYWRARTIEVLHQNRAESFLLADLQQPSHNQLSTEVLSTHDKFISALLYGGDYLDIIPLPAYPNMLEATAIYEELAKKRDIYGFLASQKLGLEFSLNQNERRITNVAFRKIASRPGIQRARELYSLDHRISARSEWYYATKNLTPKQKGAAAKLAALWGWNSQAIITAARSDRRDDLNLRFPMPFSQIVAQQAARNSIDSDWVFSLIRQESAFMHDAKSPVGALGIMQIMPATGREIAKLNSLPFKSSNALLEPAKNIQMGTLYLADLLNKFDNNLILATAAYNAGPNRVKRWRPQHVQMPGDIWVETIPFKETRNYVKNILAYQAIYLSHMNKEIKLSDALTSIPPRYPSKWLSYETPTGDDGRTVNKPLSKVLREPGQYSAVPDLAESPSNLSH